METKPDRGHTYSMSYIPKQNASSWSALLNFREGILAVLLMAFLNNIRQFRFFEIAYVSGCS